MAKLSSALPLALALGASVQMTAAAPADAASSREYSLGEEVPLHADDLQDITLQVMRQHPLLASAPGVKFAHAQRSVRSTDIASLVFFPHAESQGVKYAFQVRCVRQAPSDVWACDEARLRRYLRLPTQDFEVRIAADVSIEVALALIEATRSMVRAKAAAGAPIPETVIMILPDASGYMVSWGSPEGHQELSVRAQLVPRGDPANPEDWRTRLFEPRG